jgi:hypothetical protein
MTERIRWADEIVNGHPVTAGYVGTLTEAAFRLYGPEGADRQWLLATRLIAGTEFLPADKPDELKAEAERLLAALVSSLGAIFPTEPDESTAFQVSEARDVLAHWDAMRHDDDGRIYDRERVLADQVRGLLAIIDQAGPLKETDR